MSNEIITKKYSFELLRHTEGSIKVTVTYMLPYCVENFDLTLPSTASALETDGFDESGTSLEWDGDTPSPSVTFEKQAKDSSTRFGGYSFTDTGGWAITQKPLVSERYTSTESVRVIEETETQENVATSTDGNIVYVGPYDEYPVNGTEQRIRLVVPEDASLSPTRHAVRQTLKYASEDLMVGARSDEVVAVTAPSAEMSGLLAGLQSGISGFWVKDSQSVDTPHNTWIHEYIHTRQNINLSKTTRWIIEGSANYYAALLTYRQRLATYDQFHNLVSTTKDENAVLAEPDRWPSPYTDYKKGCRVLAALDTEIRRATDGQNTLQAVFWKLNRADDRITHPQLIGIVEDIATEDVGSWIDRYVRSTAAPEVAHEPELFETEHAVPVRGRQPVCPFCATPATGGFCSECGTELDAECVECQSPITGTESYCATCGAEI